MYVVQGVHLQNSIQAAWGGLVKFEFAPGFYPTDRQNSAWTYYSQQGGRQDGAQLALSKNKKDDLRIVAHAIAASYRLVPQPPPVIELAEESVFGVDSFQQELLYNGRSGNILKFLYREISGATLRFPFNQEIQYDLSDGKVVGFKGARLEIIEASNTRLRYRLLKNFP